VFPLRTHFYVNKIEIPSIDRSLACLLAWLTHSFIIHSGNDKPECVRYTAIVDETRDVKNYNNYFWKNDRNLAEGWFRFVSGKRMNTKCANHNYCQTGYIGWLNGKHPSVEEGRVTRRVCFSYTTSSCCNYQTYIKVLNCGSFYVYKLKPTPQNNLRYCAE